MWRKRRQITLFLLFPRGLLTNVAWKKTNHPLPTVCQRVADLLCGMREDITLFLLFSRGLLTYVAWEKTSTSSSCLPEGCWLMWRERRHHPLPTVCQRVADLLCGVREDITLFFLFARGLLTYYVVWEKTSPSSSCLTEGCWPIEYPLYRRWNYTKFLGPGGPTYAGFLFRCEIRMKWECWLKVIILKFSRSFHR
jgi:hypothetical protein